MNQLDPDEAVVHRMSHEFGRYIRRQRTSALVSLRKAAKALNVSAVYLGEVERGVRQPLKETHWDALIRAVPTIERETLERLTAKANTSMTPAPK